jgi:hypothetical protein
MAPALAGSTWLPPRQVAVMRMTERTLEAWILEGRGLGTRDAYQPWIQISKNVASPRSNLNLVKVPSLERPGHFLSRGERDLAYLLFWLGAVDVREQFPIWPWAHPHPVSHVWPNQSVYPYSHPGLRDIADDAGIRLWQYPGLRIPAVLSIDLVVTVPALFGPRRLLGISSKPRDLYLNSAPNSRTRERLELDRRYCLSASMSHLLMHPETIPKPLAVNLHAMAPLGSPEQFMHLARSAEYAEFLTRLSPAVYEQAAAVAASAAGRRVGWPPSVAHRALHFATWRQDIDVDLLRALDFSRSLRPGGHHLRAALQQRFFGEPR